MSDSPIFEFPNFEFSNLGGLVVLADADKVTTLEQWNQLIDQSRSTWRTEAFCRMPECEEPSVLYTSVQNRINSCGEINYANAAASASTYSVVTDFYADGNSIIKTYSEDEYGDPQISYEYIPITIVTTESLDTSIPHENAAEEEDGVNQNGYEGDIDLTKDVILVDTWTIERNASYSRSITINPDTEVITYGGNYRYRIDTTKEYELSGQTFKRKSSKLYTGRFDTSGQFIGKLTEVSEDRKTTVSDISSPIFPENSEFSETRSPTVYRQSLKEGSYEKEITEDNEIILKSRTETKYTGSYIKVTTKTYSDQNSTPSFSYGGSLQYRIYTKTTITAHDGTEDINEYEQNSVGSFNALDGVLDATTTITGTNQGTTTEDGGSIGGFSTKTVTTPAAIKPYTVYASPISGIGEVNPAEVVLRQLRPRFSVKEEPVIGFTSRKRTTYGFADPDDRTAPSCLTSVVAYTYGRSISYTILDPDYDWSAREAPDGGDPSEQWSPPDEDGVATYTDSYSNPDAEVNEATSGTLVVTASVSYRSDETKEMDVNGVVTTSQTGNFSSSSSRQEDSVFGNNVPEETGSQSSSSEYSGSLQAVTEDDESYVPVFQVKITSDTWKTTVREYVLGFRVPDYVTYQPKVLTQSTFIDPLTPAKNSYCVYDRGTYMEEVTITKVASYGFNEIKSYGSSDEDITTSYSGVHSYRVTTATRRTLKANAPEVESNLISFIKEERNTKNYYGTFDPITGDYSGTFTNSNYYNTSLNPITGSFTGPSISNFETSNSAEPTLPPECVLKTTGSLELPDETNVYSEATQYGGFTDPSVTEKVNLPTTSYKWNVSGSVTVNGVVVSSIGPVLVNDVSGYLFGVPLKTVSNLKENPDEDILVEGDEYLPITYTPTGFSGPVLTDLGFPVRVKWPNESNYDPIIDDITVGLYKKAYEQSSLSADYENNTFKKIKVFYQFKVPPEHTGTAFKIMWDVVTVFDGPAPDSVERGLSFVWSGRGVGSGGCLTDENDPSWYSPVYVLEPPALIGYKKVVNIRFACYVSPFGFMFQTTEDPLSSIYGPYG